MTEARRHPNSAQRPHKLSRAAFLNAAVDYKLRLPGLSFAEPPWPEGVEPTSTEEALRARNAQSQRNLEADMREAAAQRFREMGAPIPEVEPYPAWVPAVVEPEVEAHRARWRETELRAATTPAGSDEPIIPGYCLVALWARARCGSGEKAAEFLNEDAPKHRSGPLAVDEDEQREIGSRLDRHRVDRAARKAREQLIDIYKLIARRGLGSTCAHALLFSELIHTCRVADAIYRRAKLIPRLSHLTGRPLFDAIQQRKDFFKVYDAIEPCVPHLAPQFIARLRQSKAA